MTISQSRLLKRWPTKVIVSAVQKLRSLLSTCHMRHLDQLIGTWGSLFSCAAQNSVCSGCGTVAGYGTDQLSSQGEFIEAPSQPTANTSCEWPISECIFGPIFRRSWRITWRPAEASENSDKDSCGYKAENNSKQFTNQNLDGPNICLTSARSKISILLWTSCASLFSLYCQACNVFADQQKT